MYGKVKQIFDAFDGKLLGSEEMKFYVCETLSFMPVDIIRFITSKCWFLASVEDAWAFTFTGNDLLDQHLVFLSDALLEEDEDQIRYTIAHEIGHIILKHRNSTIVKQTKKEVANQEREADQFARKYLKL